METNAAKENGHLPPMDAQLVRKARTGDSAAFHELVDRHGGWLFSLAVSLVGNAADAEDVVQETLAGAFRGLAAFRGSSSVRTWLAAILLRQAAGHRRRRKRGIDLLAARAAGDVKREGSAGAAVDARIDVQAAIRALSPEHREVVVLREMQGLSYEEIAEVLGVPRGTVESRLFRARRALEELLKDYLPGK